MKRQSGRQAAGRGRRLTKLIVLPPRPFAELPNISESKLPQELAVETEAIPLAAMRFDVSVANSHHVGVRLFGDDAAHPRVGFPAMNMLEMLEGRRHRNPAGFTLCQPFGKRSKHEHSRLLTKNSASLARFERDGVPVYRGEMRKAKAALQASNYYALLDLRVMRHEIIDPVTPFGVRVRLRVALLNQWNNARRKRFPLTCKLV